MIGDEKLANRQKKLRVVLTMIRRREELLFLL
jgi:hypothetical protein